MPCCSNITKLGAPEGRSLIRIIIYCQRSLRFGKSSPSRALFTPSICCLEPSFELKS